MCNESPRARARARALHLAFCRDGQKTNHEKEVHETTARRTCRPLLLFQRASRESPGRAFVRPQRTVWALREEQTGGLRDSSGGVDRRPLQGPRAARGAVQRLEGLVEVRGGEVPELRRGERVRGARRLGRRLVVAAAVPLRCVRGEELAHR